MFQWTQNSEARHVRCRARRRALWVPIFVMGVAQLVACAGETVEMIPYSTPDGWGYVNERLEVVLEPQFLTAHRFSDVGLAVVRTAAGEWAVIDSGGEVKMAVTTSRLWHLVDDVFAYYERSGTAVVSLSRGTLATGLSTVYTGPVGNGPIPVRVLGKGWTYLELDGSLALGERYYKEAFPFVDGLAVVSLDDWSLAVIDCDGRQAFPQRFKRLGPVFSEGLTPARTMDDQNGYVDRNGEFVFTTPFEFATPFDDGRALIQVSKEPSPWLIIDAEGNALSDLLDISFTMGFENSIAEVQLMTDGVHSTQFIRSDGSVVGDMRFDSAGPFVAGYAAIEVDGRHGLLDTAGNITWSDDIGH